MPTPVPTGQAPSAAEEELSPETPRVWVLIGPLARSCAQWGDALPCLLQHLRLVQPQGQLFQLDLPGTGRLRQASSPRSVDALLAQLRQRVSDAGLQGPVGLIASSWATTIAVEWARRAPDEVGAMVLLSPSLRPFTPVLRSVRIGLWSQAAAKLLGRAQSVRAGTGLAQTLAVWRYSASRRRPHTRVLLLAGKGDEWMDWRVAAAISRAWGAALRLHPEGGHDLLQQDAAWVGRSMAEWLLPVGSGGFNSHFGGTQE